MKASMSAITSKLIGRPYGFTDKLVGRQHELCSLGNEKFDCFSLVCVYLDLAGVKRPLSFQGYGDGGKEYKELFDVDPDAANKLMVEYIASFCEELPIGKEFVGDILLAKLKKTGTHSFLGINGGNGNFVVAAPKFGITLVPLRHYTIERIFRCLLK